MKISDHLLLIIQQNGGQLHPWDFDKWNNKLIELGYLEPDIIGPEGKGKVVYKLTEKAVEYLERK